MRIIGYLVVLLSVFNCYSMGTNEIWDWYEKEEDVFLIDRINNRSIESLEQYIRIKKDQKEFGSELDTKIYPLKSLDLALANDKPDLMVLLFKGGASVQNIKRPSISRQLVTHRNRKDRPMRILKMDQEEDLNKLDQLIDKIGEYEHFLKLVKDHDRENIKELAKSFANDREDIQELMLAFAENGGISDSLSCVDDIKRIWRIDH